MDCKYITQNDIHERYLLNKLDENDKSEYLKHINSCDSCASKLESERQTLQSIRHFGKSEMKSEIARQVAELKAKENQISWDMILKVAAIFFFLVITPGLVYYYQSVEAPHVSETKLNDETIFQNKILVNEKSIKKDSPQVSDTDKLEEKQINNLMQSGRGAGGLTTKQSITKEVGSAEYIKKVEGSDNLHSAEKSDYNNQKVNVIAQEEVPEAKETNPAMKSVGLSRKTNNTISSGEEEAIDSPLPKSSFSSFDGFQKPLKVSKQEKEVNRSKMLSTNKSNIIKPSGHKKTQNENYVVDGLPAKTPGKVENNTLDLDFQVIPMVLNYKINDQSISVTLIPHMYETKFYLQESLPDSFIVVNKLNTISDMDMEWFINSKIYNENPENILLNIDENGNVLVNIRNERLYRINLNSDSTRAILVK